VEGGRRARNASARDGKEVLGSEHPSTLVSMNNLACTWKRQGRDTDSFKLMEQCIQLRVRILGAEHPYTLSSAAALMWWKGHVDSTASGIKAL
jgi:Tetratricopeptide repeat